MDCQAFDSTLLDALYDELDAPTSAAMDEHAAGCESCATRSSRLKRTQELFRPFLETALPDGLEARILAASEAAMDSSRTAGRGAKVVNLADRRVAAMAQPQPQQAQQAKSGLVAFLSRPQFAIAATFLLVLGAAALFINSDKAKMKSSEQAASVPMQSPGGATASTVAMTTPTSVDDNDQPNNINAPPSPVAEIAATATAAPSSATILALGEKGASDPSSFDRRMAPSTPPNAPNAVGRGGAGSGLSGLSQTGPTGGDGTLASNNKVASKDASLSEARSLYNAGRYNEALPKFQALAATDAEAELYVARCLAKTKGCDAAASHYDNAAKRNANTQAGSTIALEAARCYGSHGQAVAARSRYEKLQRDNYVSNEANAELEALDAPKSGAKAQAAKPVATPQAAPPAPAKPAQVDTTR